MNLKFKRVRSTVATCCVVMTRHLFEYPRNRVTCPYLQMHRRLAHIAARRSCRTVATEAKLADLGFALPVVPAPKVRRASPRQNARVAPHAHSRTRLPRLGQLRPSRSLRQPLVPVRSLTEAGGGRSDGRQGGERCLGRGGVHRCAALRSEHDCHP